MTVLTLPTDAPTVLSMLHWHPQPLPVLPVLAFAFAGWYLWAVRRVRRTGRDWRAARTASFVAGCVLTAAVTGLAIDGYGAKLFSAWMFQQLTLAVAVPPLLVLGAPGTLLLRSTSHTGCGRRVLIVALGGLRGRVGRVLLNPFVTLGLFLFSFYGLYLGGAVDLALRAAWGHIVLELFFLAAGVLFIIPILSPDPLPIRKSNLGRFFDIFLEMPLHVFFGIILMMASVPMVDAFADPPVAWAVSVLDDQQTAGALAWSYGEPVALLIVVTFAVRWSSSERADNRRTQASADAQLDSYNDYLRGLSGVAQPIDRSEGEFPRT